MDNIEYKEYMSIHQWLRWHHGKAMSCTNPDCLKKSTTYQWALKKGCEHKRDPDCYVHLCASCHRKYDDKGLPPTEQQIELGRRLAKSQRHAYLRIIVDGKEILLRDYCKEKGIPYDTVKTRMYHQKMTPAEAVLTPFRKKADKLTYEGNTMSVSEWAKQLNLNVRTLRSRVKDGWSTKDALTKPIKTGNYERN
jgi:hypothetical protein